MLTPLLVLGDCDSALSLLGHRFRVSTVTVVRGHGPYRGSRDLDHSGYRLAKAERSSHRFGHTRCSNSSDPEATVGPSLVPAFLAEQQRGR